MNFNLFNSIPLLKPRKNAFKLSHNVKLTCEMGQLVPVFVQDVLPSDRFKLSVSNIVRFAPLLAPIMSEVDVFFHFFFVPNRIIWSEWETFMTGSKNGRKLDEDQVPVPPRIVFDGNILNSALKNGQNWANDGHAPLTHGSLADYLGFQTFKSGITFNNGLYPLDELPFRAYYKIWSDWYRDENLIDDVLPDYIDNSGDRLITNSNLTDVENLMQLRRRCWKKDYFTSALPFAQKGDDVLIPGSGVSAGDIFDSNRSVLFEGTAVPHRSSSTTLTSIDDRDVHFSSPASSSAGKLKYPSVSSGSTILGGGDISLITNTRISGSSLNRLLSDSASASEGTIRELRRAFAAQKFFERRAVGGTRYIEQNYAFFGVRSSDGRLQRSEYLGGSKNPVVISQVLQTSEGTASSPLGTPAGNAVSAGGKYIFDRSFEEYGWIIGLMSIMPKPDYIQGIPKMFLRRDIYDYYWPQFAKIGEQPIENQELYFSPTSKNNDGTFGYTPRYAEYRFRNNRVCGDFKDTLKFWTLARDFDSPQALNHSFVECNPSDRIFAVSDAASADYNHLWCEIGLNVKSLRPLPKYGESM